MRYGLRILVILALLMLASWLAAWVAGFRFEKPVPEVEISEPPKKMVRGAPYTLHAIAPDGTELWTKAIGNREFIFADRRPDGGVFYLLNDQYHEFSASGELNRSWQTLTVQPRVFCADGSLYGNGFGKTPGLVRADSANRILWSCTDASRPSRIAVCPDGTVYAFCDEIKSVMEHGSSAAEFEYGIPFLVCIGADGNLLWHAQRKGIITDPGATVVDGSAFFAGSMGTLWHASRDGELDSVYFNTIEPGEWRCGRPATGSDGLARYLVDGRSQSGDPHGFIVAVDQNLELMWKTDIFQPGDSNQGSLLLGSGNRVYATSGRHANCLDHNGKILWAVELSTHTSWQPVAEYDGISLYSWQISDSHNDGGPLTGRGALEVLGSDGKSLWTLDERYASWLAGPRQTLVSVGEDQNLSRLDLATGQPLWVIENDPEHPLSSDMFDIDSQGNVYYVTGELVEQVDHMKFHNEIPEV